MSNSVKTIDGIEYNFQLLKLRQAMQVQMSAIRLIAQSMGKGDPDDDLLYNIGCKICKGLVADGFEVTDVDGHFASKPMSFNKVIMAGMQLNFPDLFNELKKSGSSGILDKLQGAGLT
jgi:hypothetical protein